MGSGAGLTAPVMIIIIIIGPLRWQGLHARLWSEQAVWQKVFKRGGRGALLLLLVRAGVSAPQGAAVSARAAPQVAAATTTAGAPRVHFAAGGGGSRASGVGGTAAPTEGRGTGSRGTSVATTATVPATGLTTKHLLHVIVAGELGKNGRVAQDALIQIALRLKKINGHDKNKKLSCQEIFKMNSLHTISLTSKKNDQCSYLASFLARTVVDKSKALVEG